MGGKGLHWTLPLVSRVGFDVVPRVVGGEAVPFAPLDPREVPFSEDCGLQILSDEKGVAMPSLERLKRLGGLDTSHIDQFVGLSVKEAIEDPALGVEAILGAGAGHF